MKPLMPPIDTPDKLFHDGNPATGAEGTIVPAEHLNNEQASIRDLQSEMIAILTAAAMAPDSTAGQLLAALNKLYAPGNDTLGALASLVGAANKLPYFTGPKGAALTDLTAFARTLLSRNDAAGVLSDLGLPELLDKKFDKTGGVVLGEITSAGITRAKGASTIEINPNDSRPRLTSKVGENGEWNSSYLQQKTGVIAHLDDIPAATSIVQGAGQSTTSVISQKGVTDALSAHGIGYGQQYMNMTGSRQPGSWYQNNTGKPIFIMVSVGRDSGGMTEQSAANISFQVGSEVVSIPMIRGANSGGAQRGAGSALIPDGAIYTVTTEFGSEVKTWWELR